ncbi:uncharacterized protein DEA37_0002474 [Paragonimus westermani]|uniref:Uncharacterized protein n=1 Tax=Paragonimus westermani TaxID=34504 RepID=A0A5J4NTF5_9TREM|nr:uncharacterized protein DEA37_0002474 [Paragonimus westermani]
MTTTHGCPTPRCHVNTPALFKPTLLHWDAIIFSSSSLVFVGILTPLARASITFRRTLS